MSKQHVEFDGQLNSVADPNDTGSNVAESISPIANGEAVVAEVFNRPHELIRRRTEVLRKEIDDLKYLADADRALLITWGGAIRVASDAKTFTLDPTAELRIRPFIGPGASSTYARGLVPATPVNLGNYLEIRATTRLRAYGTYNTSDTPGSNEYTVTTNKATAYNFSVTGNPAKHLVINYSENETLENLANRLNTDVRFTNLNMTAVVVGSPTSKVGEINRSPFYGGLDAEVHVLNAGHFQDFFDDSVDGVKINELQDGDTLAIRYDTLTNNTSGGRRQSIDDAPEQSAGVSTNLVNLRTYPHYAHNSIPICTRHGDAVIFVDGTRVAAGKKGALGGSELQDNGGTIDGPLNVVQDVTAPQFHSTAVAPEPPLTVQSAVQVDNLNAALLRGNTWAAPEDIGTETPQKGAFTELKSSTVEVGARGTGFSETATAIVHGNAYVGGPVKVQASDTGEVTPVIVMGAGYIDYLQTWAMEGVVRAVVDVDGFVRANKFDVLAGYTGALQLGSDVAASVEISDADRDTTVKGRLTVDEKVLAKDDLEVVGEFLAKSTGVFEGALTAKNGVTVELPSGTTDKIAVQVAAPAGTTLPLQTWEVNSAQVALVLPGGELQATSLDRLASTSVALKVGATYADSVELSRSTKTTYVKGLLDVAEGVTFKSTLNVDGATTLKAAAATSLTLTDALPVTSGGTGNKSSATPYGVVYATSATAYGYTAVGTNGHLLKGTGPNTPPTWVDPTGVEVGTAANSNKLLNFTWAVPGIIGSTTPNTGIFSDVRIKTAVANNPSTLTLLYDQEAGYQLVLPAKPSLSESLLKVTAIGERTQLGWTDPASIIPNLSKGLQHTFAAGRVIVSDGADRLTSVDASTLNVASANTATTADKVLHTASQGQLLMALAGGAIGGKSENQLVVKEAGSVPADGVGIPTANNGKIVHVANGKMAYRDEGGLRPEALYHEASKPRRLNSVISNADRTLSCAGVSIQVYPGSVLLVSVQPVGNSPASKLSFNADEEQLQISINGVNYIRKADNDTDLSLNIISEVFNTTGPIQVGLSGTGRIETGSFELVVVRI